MKALASIVLCAISAAAITFSALHLLYGNAEYAAVGPAHIQVETLTQILTALSAIVAPVVMKKWPVAYGVLKLVIDIIRYRDPAVAKALSRLSAVEAYAHQENNPVAVALCEQLRSLLLKVETGIPTTKPEVNITLFSKTNTTDAQ